ncbi:MAG: glycine cleavage system protein GcvH [Pseudopedobacter sp.]|nr:glycine cleavage system protein GcvH [Deinococcales bacterium]
MNIPQNLHYLKSHEWVNVEDNIATIGITDFAQDQLGDVVYVELPKVGKIVSSGETVAVVESVKTASDIYSPVSGEVLEVNSALENSPELLNESAYEKGWLFKVRLDTLSSELLDAAGYAAVAEAEG